MNNFWIEQEKIFLKALEKVEIPSEKLENVDFMNIKVQSDLNSIENKGGCYWIWTNEPVLHQLHKHEIPKRFDDGEIIYNGIAKDNVRKRIEHHLFGSSDAGWSGISMDILIQENEERSHRKKAIAEKGKVPYIIENKTLLRGNKKRGTKKGDIVQIFSPIKTNEQLQKIYLSETEKDFIKTCNVSNIYFRNGINITEDKHKNFSFRVYYIISSNNTFLEYIEKNWRSKNNILPRLCSYSSGR